MVQLDPINVKYWELAHSPAELGLKTHGDYACHCDICGDGRRASSKRLHLFTKYNFDGDAIKCFNCNWTGNMWSYLQEYHPALYNQYKREKASESFNEILTIKKLKEDSVNEVELPGTVTLDFGPSPEGAKGTLLTSLEEVELTPQVPTPQLVTPLDLPKLSNFPDAVTYLNNRGITPKEEWLYCTGKVIFDKKPLSLQDYIIIPLTWPNGQWYGFQALAWKRKDFRVVLLSQNTGWKVWNWDKINKEEPVYIFESIYDAMSSGYENVIAQLGANLEQDRIDELKKPIFCLDNQNVDEASARESMKYLEKGYKVFLWPKGSENFKDTNDLRKRKVNYVLIQKMIENNIFTGMEGILKLKMEY